MNQSDFQKIEVQSADELWSWLDVNHQQQDSIWLVTWKAAHREKFVSRDQVLDALLAYGWIDGRRMKLDDKRTMQLVAPRRQQVWAQTYKDRAARLETEGRMRPAGRASIAFSKSIGKWSTLAHVDALEDPPDLVAALQAHQAKSWWDNAAPSYRRNILRWIATAKQSETRAKRVAISVQHAALGKKVPQY